jgi:hypothetical protein
MEHNCTICSESFKRGEEIKTECKHEFHSKCISEWVIKADNCPLCRHVNPFGSNTYQYTYMYYLNNGKLNNYDEERYKRFRIFYMPGRPINNQVYRPHTDATPNIGEPPITTEMDLREMDLRELVNSLINSTYDLGEVFEVMHGLARLSRQ